MRRGQRRKTDHTIDRYKKRITSIFCANPDCKTPELGIEIHHIVPIRVGGHDDDDNLIQLCHGCHHSEEIHLHRDWNLYVFTLMKWKIEQEDGYYVIEKQIEEKHNRKVHPARAKPTTCIECGTVKTKDNCYVRKRNEDGTIHTFQSMCKSCTLDSEKERRRRMTAIRNEKNKDEL